MKQHPPQRASRAELERRLGVIRNNMPLMRRLFPERSDFLNEFASFANDVKERAEGDDSPWILEQIEQILREAGVEDLYEGGDQKSDHRQLESSLT